MMKWSKNMDKLDIMEIYIAFFETIKDSMEWAGTIESREHSSFVDGAIAQADKMLKRLDERPMPYSLAPFARVEEYGKEDVEL